MGFFDQFTADQMKKQYAANVEAFKTMRDRAVKNGGKYNGATVEQLDAKIDQYQKLSR